MPQNRKQNRNRQGKPGMADTESSAARLRASALFDAGWYCARHPDVVLSGLDPALHYLCIGARLGRDPGPRFSGPAYLADYPEVAARGRNPLLDFLTEGAAAGRRIIGPEGRHALVIHVFHLDVLDDLARHAACYPAGADRLVTFPDSLTGAERDLIAAALPGAQLFAVPNTGQDIGALLHLGAQVDLGRYGFLCKIHSKKGDRKATEWRHTLLQGVLGSEAQVARTIAAFRADPGLMLAGAAQLYLHGPSNLWGNGGLIAAQFGALLGGFDPQTADWGFIAGTCLWLRSRLVLDIAAALCRAGIGPGDLPAYAADATLAHAIERMFGLLPAARGGRALLNDALNPEAPPAVVQGFPADAPRATVQVFTLMARLYPGGVPGAGGAPQPQRSDR